MINYAKIRTASYGVVFVLCIGLCAGCATLTSDAETRLSNLENRVQALEKQQVSTQKTVDSQSNLQGRMQTFLDVNEAKAQARLKGVSFNNVTIKQIQNALKNAGLYSGEIDGKIGGKTREAIMEFQKKNNLKVDGIVGEDTWSLLSQSYKE